MEFKIPFTFVSLEKLKRRARPFMRIARKKGASQEKYLKYDEINVSMQEYRAISIRAALYTFLWVLLIVGLVLWSVGAPRFPLLAGMIALLTSWYVFITQQNYPRVFHLHRQKNIEKNLIPALQDMMVQLNSGIPLFNILLNLTG